MLLCILVEKFVFKQGTNKKGVSLITNYLITNYCLCSLQT